MECKYCLYLVFLCDRVSSVDRQETTLIGRGRNEGLMLLSLIILKECFGMQGRNPYSSSY